MSRRSYPVVAAAVLAVLTALAPQASAKPGEAHFTPTSTGYRYEGDHGIFTGDAVYSPDGHRLFWSLRLSEQVRAIVQGPMSCGATVEGKRGYGDHHPNIAADYQWHSIVPDLQLDTEYRLVATCAFTATNGHTVSPGTVEYTVRFTLHSA